MSKEQETGTKEEMLFMSKEQETGTKFDTYCGLVCDECEFKKSFGCGGCIATKGKTFHGECAVADCAISKGRRFCGECGEFPCELLKSYSFDPEHGDKGARITHCQEIKAALVAKAREGIDAISRCGHHCDYCFLGQWCGGCRSGYNCCSYATICENGVCPNVSCSESKGLDGCYECESLMDCKLGYYSNENEYIAKATAVFISKYGKEEYTHALKSAIEAGLNYPKSFDETGSVEAALKLLESYR